MKLLPLVWAALWRNRTESTLTFGALAVGFTLFGVMISLNAAYQRAIDDTRMDRLIISCAFDCGNLPSGYAEPIARTAGVTAVGGELVYGGWEEDKLHPITVTFMDEGIRRAWPELPMSADDWRLLDASQAGVFLSRQAAARRHVSAGATITLNQFPGARADGSSFWPFTVLGFIGDPPGWSQQNDSAVIVANIRYFRNTGRPDERDIVSNFRVAIDRPEHAAAVCHEIERWFTNSTPALTCVPARENSVQQQEANVNMRQISLGIGAAGLFMLLFVCANGIAESVRERLPQFGILRALGFGNAAIAQLVILEAAVPPLLAALVGSATAPIVGQFLSRLASEGLIDIPEMQVIALASVWAVIAGLLIGLLSAAAPLFRLLRTDIISMLATR
jgi:putative ABC transport system permease protein